MAAKSYKYLTDDQVEAEITRLRDSDDVKLAQRYEAVRNARRQYLYRLRGQEKVGKELAAAGYTLENVTDMLREEAGTDGA